ncbi:MAG: DUF488 domain-containing protein [Desulfobaccales bacterium]
MIKLKRVYLPPAPDDGLRVLVERLWPRGFTKERAALDVWLKEVAPSPELRRWFGHDPAKWPEFRRRYWQELAAKKRETDFLQQEGRKGIVTLVYAARDEEHNAALALKQFLEEKEHG